MKYGFLVFSGVLFISNVCYSQIKLDKNDFVNQGTLHIEPSTILSTDLDFYNLKLGRVVNDGEFFVKGDFSNEGDFLATSNRHTSLTRFVVQTDKKNKMVSGSGLTSLYNVSFETPHPGVLFQIANNLDIYGIAEFQNGILKVDKSLDMDSKVTSGMITFMDRAGHISASDKSFVQGPVEKIGSEDFVFPIGDQEYFRPASIVWENDGKGVVVAEYFFDDKVFFDNYSDISKEVLELDDTEYWYLTTDLKEPSTIILSLSWDDNTTKRSLLEGSKDNLKILRWHDIEKQWVDEGGTIDLQYRTVSTLTKLEKSGYYTLGRVKKEVENNNVKVYNLVTANGDGLNDYFIIENIHKYPNSRVEIYNRWGSKVFDMENYDAKGDGTTNVFRGYSDGKVTIQRSSKLPSGTYFYILTYTALSDDENVSVRKSGSLHLETN